MNAQNNRPAPSLTEPTITSIEIAEISGKPHSDLMKSIRKQEVSWVKVNGGNFSLVKYKDKKGEERPMYLLTKMESLYITSKFNDELRAQLVKRWYDLENHKVSYGIPRKTKQGIARLPYTEQEKKVIDFIHHNLVEGDYNKIVNQTGYSKASISLVLNGKHVNHRILKEAYRIAVDNRVQEKESPKATYNMDFINDCVRTINTLQLVNTNFNY